MTKKHPAPKQKKKQNKQLIILIASLVGGLLVFAISALIIVLASRVDEPKYDFIYSTDYKSYEYKVQDGKLTYDGYSSRFYNSDYGDDITWYQYDVSEEKSIELSLADVQELTLDSSRESPDGYRVTSSYSGSSDIYRPIAPGFPGETYSSESSMVLQKGSYSKQLKLEGDRYDFRFIGWVSDSGTSTNQT